MPLIANVPGDLNIKIMCFPNENNYLPINHILLTLLLLQVTFLGILITKLNNEVCENDVIVVYC